MTVVAWALLAAVWAGILLLVADHVIQARHRRRHAERRARNRRVLEYTLGRFPDEHAREAA